MAIATRSSADREALISYVESLKLPDDWTRVRILHKPQTEAKLAEVKPKLSATE